MRMQLIKVVAAVLALSLAATVEQSPAVYGADRATEDRVRSLENQLEQLTKAMDRFEGGLERFRCKQNSKPDADANASPSVLSNSYVEQGLAEYRRGDFSAACAASRPPSKSIPAVGEPTTTAVPYCSTRPDSMRLPREPLLTCLRQFASTQSSQIHSPIAA